MKYLIATVGITHSGKTQFGKKLKSELPNLPVLDSDEIYASLSNLIPDIKEVEKQRTNISANKPRLRHILFEERITFFLENNSSVLCTNGNTTKEGREKLRKLAKINNAQFIIIYFNIDETEILKRISNTDRTGAFLTNSKSSYEVLEKQKGIFEAPDSEEANVYFEIKDDTEQKLLKKRLKGLLFKNQ